MGLLRFNRNKLSLLLMGLASIVVMVGVLVPTSASAVQVSGGGSSSVGSRGKPAACSKDSFFGLEPWYQYLDLKSDPTTGHCEVTFPGDTSLLGSKSAHKSSAILLIVLAVVDDLLRVAGMVSIIFVIVGGFKFITSAGEPEAAASARKTIMFALVGLAVALIAVVIISFIGGALGT